MMQEYEEDFFFEEDKIKPMEKQQNNLLVPVEESATISKQETPKDNSEDKQIEEDPNEMTEVEAITTTDCIYNDLRQERYNIYHQDLMGMTVTSGSIVLNKDEKNLIGISIGGGAPLCPCLYIVQIFDNTPAFKEGTLQSGDELVGVNGVSVKGKTKLEVAKMIQTAENEVTINYNKLHADPKQGKSLDIVMKKVKHRLVENMSSGAADAFGLSRAILCNDMLVAKLNGLKNTESTHKLLVDHAKRMLKAYFEILVTYKSLGDTFAAIGVKEPQARASEAFTKFGQYHRQLEKDGIYMLKDLKPILADMGTYLNKAIPDTKLTIQKYADTKFEYLSYCLKVKEMDDEEYGYNTLQEPLYRVETGNYEYRLILRCRQDARARFARLRSDVLVKLELLENKKTKDLVGQLRKFIKGISSYHNGTLEHLREHSTLFPIEVDLTQNAFQYKSTGHYQDIPADEEDFEFAKEIKEYNDILPDDEKKTHKITNLVEKSTKLLPELDSSDQNDDKSNQTNDRSDQTYDRSDKTDNVDADSSENLKLLTELGLADDFGDFQNGAAGDSPKTNDADDVFEKLLNDLSFGN